MKLSQTRAHGPPDVQSSSTKRLASWTPVCRAYQVRRVVGGTSTAERKVRLQVTQTQGPQRAVNASMTVLNVSRGQAGELLQ